MKDILDIFVVGGGINGVGIARDAVGRGLNVSLCEKSDLASATSSASTKLIHGGLRYLEHYAFRLVRESLIEREVLLQAAPHIIYPMRFVLPHHKGLRPAFLIRLGLFLYDNLGGRKILPRSRSFRLKDEISGPPLKEIYQKAFEYSDCWVDDARLVVLNALDAQERGAEILTRTRCIGVKRVDGIWRITLEDKNGAVFERKAKVLVNAAGPWVSEIYRCASSDKKSKKSLRLVKGSHIVVKRCFQGEHAYLFQNRDGRIVFAIPYLEDFTLIGTTDLVYNGDPSEAEASNEEKKYLCTLASEYFSTPILEQDIVWSYSGVRPLYDDGNENASTVTRDYVLEVEDQNGFAPLLSVFGGKLTTYRKLAEDALRNLEPYLRFGSGPWTDCSTLPGGDIPNADFEEFAQKKREEYEWIPQPLLDRLLRAYGTRIDRLIGTSVCMEDLGESFGAGLYESELRYLIDVEWAETIEDVLWRRTKLGIRLSDDEKSKVSDWLDRELGKASVSLSDDLQA